MTHSSNTVPRNERSGANRFPSLAEYFRKRPDLLTVEVRCFAKAARRRWLKSSHLSAGPSNTSMGNESADQSLARNEASISRVVYTAFFHLLRRSPRSVLRSSQ